MIPVIQKPEYDEFDSQVRRPGLEVIGYHRIPR